MKQKAKLVIPKTILKKSNLKIIKEDLEEADVNLKRDSNSYQYNVIDDFRQMLINLFFGDFMKIDPYHELMQQYLARISPTIKIGYPVT